MKEKRKAWKENMSGYAPEKLVFLDESGINVNMTRFYARSKGGSRAVDAVPLWKPQNMTVLSSIQLNGETAYTTYSGGTTSERFVDYLRNILIPTLSPDSVVVMDNMRSHHTQAVKDLLEQAGVQYLYLQASRKSLERAGSMRTLMFFDHLMPHLSLIATLAVAALPRRSLQSS